MKNFILLGATGSIGTQVLDIIRKDNNFKLLGFSFGNNIKKAIEIIKEFKPKYVAITNLEYINSFNEFSDLNVFSGDDSLSKLVNMSEDYVLINSVSGIAGLKPTICAIKNHKDILLANKETLVCAGEIINKLVKENNVNLIPIDSEHSAISQCLKVGSKNEIKNIIITASGGAFRDKNRGELDNVTLEDATCHPNWSMGTKITIDSSTMVNKGLEIIEAHFLFDVPYEKIKTVIHKESIIHSMVEYFDGSVIAHLATPDMHLPIMYAMYYPHHLKGVTPSLDFNKLKNLSFEEMNYERFPMVELAYKVGELSGVMPLVYSTSNEVAVELFKQGKIKYLDIENIINEMVNNYIDKNILNPTLDDLIEIDQKVRKDVLEEWS